MYFPVSRLSKNYAYRHVKPGCITVRTYHGNNRQQVAEDWHNADVILTTYDTLRSEYSSRGPLYATEWARVMLDEGRLDFPRTLSVLAISVLSFSDT